MKKVIIVGAGPAGLFAAQELAQKAQVIIIEKGKDVKNRDSLLNGVGGAGTFSDGTLNLRPDIVGSKTLALAGKEEAWKLIKEIDEIFLKYGAPKEMLQPKEESIIKLKLRAASVGGEFIEIPQRHLGTDKAPKVIQNFKEDLEKKGVQFLLETEVTDLLIKNQRCQGVFTKNDQPIKADFVILAPGRSGFKLMEKWIKKYNIAFDFGPIDVGVRVEVPALVMKPVTDINRDPKFHITTPTYDDFVRTFCVNQDGFVTKEEYEGFVTTNGHSFRDRKSGNTNFAFLVHMKLTEPVENTTAYGSSIAQLATTIGGGRPILQRLSDLKRGRRSKPESILRNPVKNTLKDVTPGDISMALPHRIVTDIKEGLAILDKIIPGIASGSTLLYAPEIKFYALCLKVKNNLETSIENLFAAGDGCGLSHDIVNAAATGILAAKGVLAKTK